MIKLAFHPEHFSKFFAHQKSKYTMSHVETGVDSQSHATSLADCIHLMPRVRRRISSSGRQLAVRNCDVSATTGCRTWGGRTPPHASDMSRAGGACSLHPLSNMQQRAGRGRSCLGCGQGGRRQWLMVTHAGTWAYVTRETGQRLHGTSTCRCTVGSWLYIICRQGHMNWIGATGVAQWHEWHIGVTVREVSEGGEGGGQEGFGTQKFVYQQWYPPDFPTGKFRLFPRWSLSSRGGGSRKGNPLSSCGVRPFQYFPGH